MGEVPPVSGTGEATLEAEEVAVGLADTEAGAAPSGIGRSETVKGSSDRHNLRPSVPRPLRLREITHRRVPPDAGGVQARSLLGPSLSRPRLAKMFIT